MSRHPAMTSSSGWLTSQVSLTAARANGEAERYPMGSLKPIPCETTTIMPPGSGEGGVPVGGRLAELTSGAMADLVRSADDWFLTFSRKWGLLVVSRLRWTVPRTTEAGPDPPSCLGIEFDALALLGTGTQHGASGAHGTPL